MEEKSGEVKVLTPSERRELRRQKILNNTEERVGRFYGIAGVRAEAAPVLDGISKNELKKTISNQQTPKCNNTNVFKTYNDTTDEYQDKEIEETMKKIDNISLEKFLQPKTFSTRANISLVILVMLFSSIGISFLPSIFLFIISDVMVEVGRTSPNVNKARVLFLFMEAMKRLVLAIFIHFIINIILNYSN
uniref:ABC transmembrane type-1 domain-containing protein n=1 Tax=Parastrongyloides trichosuri TaxID=131310 RepID=A0A0N5A1L2_PARTI